MESLVITAWYVASLLVQEKKIPRIGLDLIAKDTCDPVND